MDPDFIDALIEILRRTGLDEIEYEQDGARLRIRASGVVSALPARPAAAPVAMPALPAGHIELRATMPGVFYRAPDAEAAPFVAVGDKVAEGQTLALLEAMKMLTPIAADAAGTVQSIHAEDAATVARGDLLFVIAPGE